MDAVFIQILNMGIAAVWPILAVICLRLLLKKSPKWTICLLWAVAAVRLICPLSIQSAFSLIPSAQTIHPSVVRYAQEPSIDSGIPMLNNTLNPVLRASFTPNPGASVNPLQIWLSAAGILWLAGVSVMLCAALLSCIRLHRRMGEAVLGADGVWYCDHAESPFIIGIIRPQIYLPSGIEQAQIPYVLAHEQAHLKRKDHWWKLLSYLLLSVYWFHPLVWAAYLLFGRDIELACDEKVIRDYDTEQKKNYSHAMVSCSIPKKTVLSCPLAFGEIGVKKRVKAVLHYKKPAIWAVTAAVLVCVAAAVCFLTNPIKEREPENWDERPMLKIEGADYVDPYISESSLPYGYLPAGTLTAEQAYNTGLEGMEYYTNPEYPDDFYVYQQCGTRVSIDEEDNTQRQWAFRRWVKINNNAAENRRLTLDDVRYLAEKGTDLSWADFELYPYTETGSGLYIRVYEIDKMFSVWIGGANEKEAPMYIYLVKTEGGKEERIELRTDSVEELLFER